MSISFIGVLSVLLGCVCVGIAVLDILLTALHPTAGSPVSARFHRLVWAVIRRVAGLLPEGDGRRVLSWTLPLSVVGLVLSWLFWLLVGFGLVYAPSMGSPGAFHFAGQRLGWGDAFYFSGVCLTSVGFGDIVPLHGWLRVLAVGEGLSGLVIVGVAITYILAVFPMLPLSNILAITLNEESNGQVDAVPLVQRYLASDAAEPLAQRCREVANMLMVLAEAHATHPVLFYAHPARPERSFLRTMIVTQHLVALLRYGLRRADYPTLVQDPRVVRLEESFIIVLRTLGASQHLHVLPPPADADATEGLRREYEALVGKLRAAGLRKDALIARGDWEAFVRFRLVTDPYVEAYSANSGYTREELWGAYPPLRGTTAPIPLLEADENEEADAAG